MSPVTHTIGRDKGTVDVLLKSKDYLVDDKEIKLRNWEIIIVHKLVKKIVTLKSLKI